jgi:hypothetical protein
MIGGTPDWDGDLFRLYQKGLNGESWQDDFAADARDQGQESLPVPDVATDYSRALFGGPGADLLGSDYTSRHPEPTGESQWEHGNGPPSVSMPSISQPMSPISHSMPSISGPVPSISGPVPPERDEFSDTGSLVRPYARTRGRTRTDYDLAIETLVSTSDRGRAQTNSATPEHRSICGLCVEARSVAEISAHLRLPLGVVRVLVGDMAGLGLVLIHDSGMVVGDRPSMEFLERVLSGLRRL